ncbi:LCP family protein [Streptomyces sp. TLI_146]|uniref:LCP family protein n=1 Tax=Streptomyces sp. TLI_146 TaxID=1938858 RepID=UPI000C707927|nr:LCP family protein [Streptomyces sp. TLI_146]PKV86089.1 LytR family transcriptional attenuator [Streptomyces sp. TLI_146]
MGQNSVRGEGTRPRRVQNADQLGWDESLYGEEGGGGKPPAPRSSGDEPGDGKGAPEKAAADGGGHRRGGPRKRVKKKGKRRILRWVASTLALLILGTAGAGYLYYKHLSDSIRKGDRSAGGSNAKKSAANADGQTPLNVLLIGSDDRNKAENLKLGGSKDSVGSRPLADVQMLMHVSADRKSASVISIPRDTRVDIPACVNPETKKTEPATNTLINEALGRGGAGCVLDTWEKLTGVYIDHWVMVDFAGVVSMADAVGGADVCVKQNVYDGPKPKVPGGSHLRLTAGTHKIKGEQALQWLRTRHAFESDLGRAKAQHMYLNSVMRELKKQNAFTNPGRIMGLAETAVNALQVSRELGTPKKLYDLGMEFKSVPMERMNMLTMPRIQDPKNKDHVLPAPGSADALWSLLRDDKPLDKKDDAPAKPESKGPAATPAGSLALSVVNGTGINGAPPTQKRATTVSDTLKNKGFYKAKASDTRGSAAVTTLTYPKSAGAQGKADAMSVATAMELPSSAVKVSADVSTLTLTVGADWRTGATYPKKDVEDSDPLKDTENVNGASKSDCMDVYWPYRW